MKRPISLTIVAVVWFSMGVLGVVVDEIYGRGLQIPNINLVSILVGIGLLSGWRICRWYAVFATGFTCVFILPFALWAFWNADELVYQFPFTWIIDQRPHATTLLVVIVLFILSQLVLAGWSFLVLKRRKVREFFRPCFSATI
jgi:hypothetical protein